MPLADVRKLTGTLQRLFDNNEPDKELKYFNPSSAFPYLYIRATKREEISGIATETNYMYIYNYYTDVIKKIEVPYNNFSVTLAFYQGIEDARLILYKNRVWFIASSTHISDSLQSEMIIGYFNQEVSDIEYIQHLDLGFRPVKNICPFVYQNKLCVIDAYTLQIYEIMYVSDTDQTDGGLYKPIPFKVLKPCHNIQKYTMRGSTSPIHLHGNLWGCVVHEHIMTAGKPEALSYINYWIEFDMECGIITFFSTPFYISCWGTEFISGIEYYRNEDKIEIYFGIEDKIALVIYTNLYNLRYE